MPDREKVIKGLECCEKANNCGNCPYDGECAKRDFALTRDAIALLREQEASPIFTGDGSVYGCTWYYICDTCKGAIDYKDPYCRHCGKKVKWDDA